MSKREAYRVDAQSRDIAMLAWEMDSSLLELLCEDGFLSPTELPEEESSAAMLALLRRAVRRGFPAESRREETEAHRLWKKRLDTLRIWTELTDEDVHLRAPPLCG